MIDLAMRLLNHPSRLQAKLSWSSPVTLLSAPSGMGKSTFIEVLVGCGSLAHIEGKLVICGTTCFDSNSRIWLKPSLRPVAWMPQNFGLVPYVSARTQLFAEHHPQQQAILTALDCASGWLDRAAGDLSMGQQQRIALARVLLSPQPLLLLDEPFHALDASLRCKARRLVQQVAAQQHKHVIIVSHDDESAFTNAPVLTIKENGELSFLPVRRWN